MKMIKSAQQYSMFSKKIQAVAIILGFIVSLFMLVKGYAHVDLVEVKGIDSQVEERVREVLDNADKDKPRDDNGDIIS